MATELPGAGDRSPTWVPYADGPQHLTGFLAPACGNGPAPGVLLCPAWLGISPSIQSRAQRLAALGYTAFAADMFGKPTDVAQGPRALVKPFADDRGLMRARARAALTALRARPECDPARVVVAGYCFGGCVTLELARDGATCAGFVSLHGELDTPILARRGDIKGKLLALCGDDDPVVPFARVVAFRDEMRAAAADFEIDIYSGAKHSFTGEGSLGAEKTPEAVLSPKAEARSWRAMLSFFTEVLAAEPDNVPGDKHHGGQ